MLIIRCYYTLLWALVDLGTDKMPHTYNKLNDVTMEEVENMHTQGDNELDNEMEICNLSDTKIVGERGALKHFFGIKRAPDAPN